MSGGGCQVPAFFFSFLCPVREEPLSKRPRVNGYHIFHVWLRLPTHGTHPEESPFTGGPEPSSSRGRHQAARGQRSQRLFG